MAMSRGLFTAAVAALVFAASAAFGQTQTYPIGPDLAKQQQERQQKQPLNNQPLWSEVRSGAPQTTTVIGRETNVLIQPEGQTWRSLRTPLLAIGGWFVALAVIGLAVFYAGRGKLDYDKKPRDRVIERFSPMDRYAHWLLAITWVTLAITGLILSIGKTVLLPLIGYTLFSWLAMASKALHNFVGPVLIVAIPFLFVRFIRDNGIGIDDFKWFINIMGYFKGHEHPSGRFNAGEKVVFWFMLVILSTVLVVTGLVLVFPNFNQTRETMQIANVIHVSAAYVAIALACVHIYLGTIGMTDAYRAMRYGYVSESWAKHHHLRWYEDVVAGRSREHFVAPEKAAQAEGDTAGTMSRRTA